MKQIENLSEEKKDQLLKLAIKATTSLMTPQDFFFAYAGTPCVVKLISSKISMMPMLTLTEDGLMSYKKQTKHIKCLKRSIQITRNILLKRLEVSTDIIVQMRKDAILTLQAEAQQEMDDRKKEYDDAVDAWKKKKEELKEARKDAKLVGPKKTADPAAYKLTRALVETLKTEVKILNSKKVAQKLIYESMDYEDILRLKIKQWADNNNPEQKSLPW